jgi:hypothetical protein
MSSRKQKFRKNEFSKEKISKKENIERKNLEELAVYLMHIITTIRWHMDRLEFYFKNYSNRTVK